MKIIYIANGDVSVYDSQVLSLLDFYVEQKHEVHLIQGYASSQEKEKLLNKIAAHHLEDYVVWFESAPVYPWFEKRKRERIYQALLSIPGYDKAVIHVRGSVESTLVKKIIKRNKLNIPFLADIRGLFESEFDYKIKRQKGLRKVMTMYQKKYIGKCWNYLFAADNLRWGVSSVSPLITDFINKVYGGNGHCFYFNPNIAGKSFVYDYNSRKEIREKYGLKEDDLVAVCSTGGNSLWQKDYLTIDKLLSMGVKVINLSKMDYGKTGCITTSVPFKEMYKILSAADVAVLWRDDTLMNNAASPSKFSEFAVMGLYVLHNDSVAVASSYIKKSGAGLIIKDLDELQQLPTLNSLTTNRKQWITEGREFFGVECVGKSYLGIYENLLA